VREMRCAGLVIDIDNDHNTEERLNGVARMRYLHEVFKGRYPSNQDCQV